MNGIIFSAMIHGTFTGINKYFFRISFVAYPLDSFFKQYKHLIFAVLLILHLRIARVAKLVDALSSGGSIRKVVLVRIQSRAQVEFETFESGDYQVFLFFRGIVQGTS